MTNMYSVNFHIAFSYIRENEVMSAFGLSHKISDRVIWEKNGSDVKISQLRIPTLTWTGQWQLWLLEYRVVSFSLVAADVLVLYGSLIKIFFFPRVLKFPVLLSVLECTLCTKSETESSCFSPDVASNHLRSWHCHYNFSVFANIFFLIMCKWIF